MKWNWLIQLLGCLVVFHSPDGKELQIESQQIVAIRALTQENKQHLATGTKTIIYTGGQNFGVIETHAQVDALLKECK